MKTFAEFQGELAKKEYTGKIDSGVLKAYPELDPNKPSDYIKLKRLTSKVRKAHYKPQGEVFIEDAAPTNNVGGGQIAGTAEAGDDPPVKKKKKKGKKKKRYIYGGRGSRKMWMPEKDK